MNMRSKVMEAFKQVNDPELHLSIIDLGLVYRIDTSDDRIEVDFTLTYPGCPVEREIRRGIIEAARRVSGIDRIVTRLVWEPLWSPQYMSDEAKLTLGYPV